MKLKYILPVIFLFCLNMKAQENLPYYEIPEASKEYTAGTVVARMIDGLGFRYHWATEGLREEDLQYKPNEEARSCEETIHHVYQLSKVILNTAIKEPNGGAEETKMTFEEKRKKTLVNFKTAAEIFRESGDLSEFTIVFKNEKGTSEFPFWNQINGPIADALWHCGQIVSFRRSSGNPFNAKPSVFTGKVRK